MRKAKKTCAMCGNSFEPPLSMKPMYGLGGMMLVCGKPQKGNEQKVVLVAPENKCRSWTPKGEGEHGEAGER